MNRFLFLLTGAVAALAGYSYMTGNDVPYLDEVKGYIDNGEIVTLEARYSPELLMAQNKKELLGKEGKSLSDPLLKFSPYLLLDVKYLDDQKSREGIVLWSLSDGEMVINADNWDKTHGFHDALEAGASRQDFRLLNALSFFGGSSTRERLQRELSVDSGALEIMIESAKKKHLVLSRGPEVKLHFQDPLFLVSPETKMKQTLVTKPFERSASLPKNYSKGQIERISQAAFGPEFKIRSAKEVFLPVYMIQVQNPDGSTFTTFWNALNGKKVTNL